MHNACGGPGPFCLGECIMRAAALAHPRAPTSWVSHDASCAMSLVHETPDASSRTGVIACVLLFDPPFQPSKPKLSNPSKFSKLSKPS
eukprot:2205919-Pyramimonas_sp.AAC.1